MTTLTISSAARLCRVDRRTLQRAIRAGRLHLDARHCLTAEALLLAGYPLTPTPQDMSHAAPQPMPHKATKTPHAASRASRRAVPLEQIAALRQEHPQLTLRAFAQLLYEHGIRTQHQTAINAGTLGRWLARAGLH